MKTALLVIDYINGIINGSCKDYVNKYPILIKSNKLISECRKKAIPIYFIRLAYTADYKNIPKHSRGFNYIKENGLFQIGSDSTKFAAELSYQKDDTVINKTAASPFHGTGLMDTLNTQGIDQLIFTGLATDNAINIGVREANDAGYYTIIAEDACGASSEDFHRWSITMLQKIANEIVSVDALIKKMCDDDF